MTVEHGAVGGEASGSRLAESRVRVMRMDMEGIEVRGASAAWVDEIEHAIDNVKRTNLDKWTRREWHKAGARDHWSEGRKAEWKGRRLDWTAGHGTRCPLPAFSRGRHCVRTAWRTRASPSSREERLGNRPSPRAGKWMRREWHKAGA